MCQDVGDNEDAKSDMTRPESRDPALRISQVVRGRERVGHRVRYRVDPQGISTEMAVPETVVLKRWG